MTDTLPTTRFPFELKIKGMSLAAEARIIRKYENKIRKARKHLPELESTFWSLRNHRMGLSGISRSTHLAYGFLRGKSYLQIEQKRYSDPDWAAIDAMVVKYGSGTQQANKQKLEQWKQEAGECAVHDGKPKPPRIRPSNKKPVTTA